MSTGARYCELISFAPEDFDFMTDMLSVNKSTVEVTAEFHPEGFRFLNRRYTKNGEHRRFKIDHSISAMVQEHIADNGIETGQPIFPVRLFTTRIVTHRERMGLAEIAALGLTSPLPNGRQYRHGTLGAYATAKCRCEGCRQWAADYGRDRKRERTGRAEREWSAARRHDPTEYMGKKYLAPNLESGCQGSGPAVPVHPLPTGEGWRLLE